MSLEPIEFMALLFAAACLLEVFFGGAGGAKPGRRND